MKGAGCAAAYAFTKISAYSVVTQNVIKPPSNATRKLFTVAYMLARYSSPKQRFWKFWSQQPLEVGAAFLLLRQLIAFVQCENYHIFVLFAQYFSTTPSPVQAPAWPLALPDPLPAPPGSWPSAPVPAALSGTGLPRSLCLFHCMPDMRHLLVS